MAARRVAVVGGHGKTGRAVCDALAAGDVAALPLGRGDWPDLVAAAAGCEAAYVIAPNLHPDEPAYVGEVLTALIEAGIRRVVYHSVASPHAPSMPHHLGKAASEDLVRRSNLDWTILQPGAYLQNLDLTGPIDLPYSPDVPFGFLDLADLGRVAAVVLTQPGHVGATYELATRVATVRELAAEAGVEVRHVPDPKTHPWLSAMFEYYDDHGLLVGTRTLAALLG
ncbi:nmra family transcriptional regulator [Nocardioides oleivorans]|uniref:Nmra family transcriptional regulator n=1 Tax=Nocardioides oleivorans TaxID=273676 RepID=A0A4Q2RY88_9ACTN|nr:NAD(P)H-binding protein [Nocardioides oleivorans]RYB92954.1 nmra family transcriptional regulator [Nocardioides oleivorans]